MRKQNKQQAEPLARAEYMPLDARCCELCCPELRTGGKGFMCHRSKLVLDSRKDGLPLKSPYCPNLKAA